MSDEFSSPRLTLHDGARRLSDLFCLWRLCGKPGCRRAQACRGGVHRCLGALSLVPEEAYAWFQLVETQYLPGKEQIFRNSVRDRQDFEDLKIKGKPKTRAELKAEATKPLAAE